MRMLTMGATTLVCTLLPAVRIHRAAARGDGLRLAATRVSAGRAERRVRASLVCAQIALAIALLCTSGALVKSLSAVLSVAPGFTARRVLTMQMMLPPALYPDVPARAQSLGHAGALRGRAAAVDAFEHQKPRFVCVHPLSAPILRVSGCEGEWS